MQNIQTASFRGIEALAEARPTSGISDSEVALSLLVGFSLMLLIESASHSHSPHAHSIPLSNAKPIDTSEIDFDAELAELEGAQGSESRTSQQTPLGTSEEIPALPLTLGLVIHSLADGFALGVSFFPGSNESKDSSLSAIVFLAIIIHKRAFYRVSVSTLPD